MKGARIGLRERDKEKAIIYHGARLAIVIYAYVQAILVMKRSITVSSGWQGEEQCHSMTKKASVQLDFFVQIEMAQIKPWYNVHCGETKNPGHVKMREV
ncbi:hypothetical protein ANO11243_066120 [Dothideomycetidae sp. 11243]|nr:hypothetical protein ANO11243_066120 [fungal sp. No.11243]